MLADDAVRKLDVKGSVWLGTPLFEIGGSIKFWPTWDAATARLELVSPARIACMATTFFGQWTPQIGIMVRRAANHGDQARAIAVIYDPTGDDPDLSRKFATQDACENTQHVWYLREEQAGGFPDVPLRNFDFEIFGVLAD